MTRFLTHSLIFLTLTMFCCWALICISPKSPNHYMNAYDIKMDQLADSGRGATVILLGGSATAFGYNSAIIEEQTGFPVVNAGLHAGLGQPFILNDVVPYLRPNDILVYSPEHTSFSSGDQTLNLLFLYSDRYHKESLSPGSWMKRIRKFPIILHNQVMLIGKHPQPDSTYSIHTFNSYGDMVWHWNHDTCLVPEIHYDRSKYSEQERKTIHQVCQTLETLPCTLILFPAPVSETFFTQTRPLFYEMDSIFNSYSLRFEPSLTETFFPDSLFYDTHHHLRRAAAEERSYQISSIINEYNETRQR